MPIIKFETGEEVEFVNMPTMKDIEEAANSLGITQKVQERQKIQEAGAKANEFLNKSPMEQLFSKETAKEILPSTGKVVKDVLVDTPVKVAKSLVGVPLSVATGGKKTIPGTYQAEAQETTEKIIEGEKPLRSALTPFITVPLDVTSTIGVGAGVKQLGKTVIKTAKPIIAKQQAKNAVKESAKVDDLIGKVFQGKAEDVAKAKQALSQIELKGIKSYKELGNTIDKKISSISNKLDEVLETNTEVKPISELSYTTKVKDPINGTDLNISHNYVRDALAQLDDFYTKTNNIPKQTAVKQMIAKAETQGLSVKELNDIAKLHGQDLSAYNASGELASGLTKQAAENTRMGVKNTARNIFGDKTYQMADQEMTKLIRTRDLVKGVEEKVVQLQQKINKRGFGEKVGRLVFQVADKLTGGGLKGFAQSLIPRGQGLKIMNALDLEKALSKNLKKLDDAINSKSEGDIIKKLEDILNQSSEQPLKNVPTKNIKSKIPKKPISTQSTTSSLKGKGFVDKIKNQIKNNKSGVKKITEDDKFLRIEFNNGIDPILVNKTYLKNNNIDTSLIKNLEKKKVTK